MPLDRNAVKAKLTQLQSKGKKNADGTFEKKDFSKIYWKPKVGKQVVRLVPIKSNPSLPFQEVYYHNNIGGKKRLLSLKNWGEKDPIVSFSDELRKSSDKTERDTGWQMAPKAKYVAQLVVRGEEHNGTRLWEANATNYKDVMAIIADDDYGDILDVNEGFDLTIEGVEDSFNGNKYVKCTILAKRKPSPLAETEAEIKKLMNEQYDPLTLMKKSSYEELLALLEKHMSPEDEEETQVATVEVEEQVKDALDEALEGEAEDIEELPFVETEEDEDTPPFTPDPVIETSAKSALAQASKRVIAKNNEEIKAAAKEAAKTKASPKVKTKETEAKATTPGSNKAKFDELFKKK